VLVRIDGQTCWLNSECESFALALRTSFYLEFHSARNLIGIHDLEAFFGAFRVFGSNKSTEPEDIFLDGE
jgi:hypothetical protein